MSGNTIFKFWNGWTVASLILWGLGVAVPFINVLYIVSTHGDARGAVDLLTGYLVAGLLIGGLSLLPPAITHNASGKAATTIDGVGKLAAILGWAVGLTSGVFLALRDTTTNELVMGAAVLVAVVPVVAGAGAWVVGKIVG